MNCPECNAEDLTIDLDNNKASCVHCGCWWNELDAEEWWTSEREQLETIRAIVKEALNAPFNSINGTYTLYGNSLEAIESILCAELRSKPE